jgi:hypothetical protein
MPQTRKATREDFDFPADATPEEIDAFLAKQAPIRTLSPKEEAAKSFIDRSEARMKTGLKAKNLPAAGAVLGSIAGPPGAAIGGAVGSLAKQVIDPQHTSGLDAAIEVGKDAAMQGAFQKGGEIVGAGMQRAAPWLMQKALKPAAPLIEEYRTSGPKIVRTLLDEGVNVTAGGLERLQSLLKQTNDEIRQLVSNAPGSVTKKNVAARVLPVAAKRAQQTNPTKDLQAIGDTVEEFIKHPVIKGPTLTIPEAQAMKQGTYATIGKKYGEVSSAEIEAQKALARGLKEEVADAVPEVSKLNLRDSELMAATDAVGRQVAVAGNKDPVGFAWVTQNPTTFLASLIDRNPVIKSMLANGMWKNAARVAKVSPDVIRAAVVALTTRDSDAPPPQE